MFLRLQFETPKMDDTSKAGPSGTDYKTRRPHTKSRYGCTKCKERRIKVYARWCYLCHVLRSSSLPFPYPLSVDTQYYS